MVRTFVDIALGAAISLGAITLAQDHKHGKVKVTINYPDLSRTVNQGGPGRAESFTVRTPSGKVSGKVKISGLKGSFGCYTFRVTP